MKEQCSKIDYCDEKSVWGKKINELNRTVCTLSEIHKFDILLEMTSMVLVITIYDSNFYLEAITYGYLNNASKGYYHSGLFFFILTFETSVNGNNWTQSTKLEILLSINFIKCVDKISK